MTKPAARKTSRPEHTELHKLLIRACPAVAGGGEKTIKALAPHLGVSFQYVYRWIELNTLPPKYAIKVLNVAEGRVTREELVPFVPEEQVFFA